MNRSKTGFSSVILCACFSACLLFAGQSALAGGGGGGGGGGVGEGKGVGEGGNKKGEKSGAKCGRDGHVRLLIDDREIWSGPGLEIATRYKMLTIPEASRATEGIPLADLFDIPLEQVASIKMLRCSGQVSVLEPRDFDREHWKYYLSPNKRGFFKLVEQRADDRARTSVKHIDEIQVTSRPRQGNATQ